MVLVAPSKLSARLFMMVLGPVVVWVDGLLGTGNPYKCTDFGSDRNIQCKLLPSSVLIDAEKDITSIFPNAYLSDDILKWGVVTQAMVVVVLTSVLSKHLPGAIRL